MLHLLKYNVKVKLKNFGMTFWPLAFPLILGTLFYFAFGNISDADFQTVPVAVVEEAHADQVFLAFLDQIEGDEDKLLSVEKMTDEQAQDKLEAKKSFRNLLCGNRTLTDCSIQRDRGEYPSVGSVQL